MKWLPLKRLRPQRQHGLTNFHVTPLLSTKTSLGRSKALVFVFALCFLILAGRAAYIQAYNTAFFLEKGEERHTRVFDLPANRGRILDRNGIILASSVRAKTVFIQIEDFKTIKDKKSSHAKSPEQIDQELRQLSQLLDIPLAKLRQRIAKSDRGYYELKPRVDTKLADAATDLGFTGVYAKKTYRRDYPQGESVAQVVGLTNNELQGTEGIERAYNDTMQGLTGKEWTVRRPTGMAYEYEVLQEPIDGLDVRLSLDSRIQFIAYQELRQAVLKHKAESGSLVMLDARTGEVLAMANYPSFDPADRKNIRPALTRNPAVMNMYEPGSSMKPLTVALALQENRVTPNTVIATGNGRINLHGFTISDTGAYGDISVSKVIQKSSNVGTVKISHLLEARDMWEFLSSVGLGKRPDIKFPSAASGILRHYKSWRPIEKATISYGYGVAASLLQIAQAYTIFCADGYFLPATLEKRQDLILGERVIDRRHAQQMRDMMQTVTEKGGTATQAAMDGYTVGGKTGTVRKQVGRGYSRTEYGGYFVGFAPVSNPRVITAVMINSPREGGYYGGVVAAPVFRETTSQALQILQVRPDKAKKEGQE